MRVLLINQTFYPDCMATGQYLPRVALALAQASHEVTVITSSRAYVRSPGTTLPQERSLERHPHPSHQLHGFRQNRQVATGRRFRQLLRIWP